MKKAEYSTTIVMHAWKTKPAICLDWQAEPIDWPVGTPVRIALVSKFDANRVCYTTDGSQSAWGWRDYGVEPISEATTSTKGHDGRT